MPSWEHLSVGVVFFRDGILYTSLSEMLSMKEMVVLDFVILFIPTKFKTMYMMEPCVSHFSKDTFIIINDL